VGNNSYGHPTQETLDRLLAAGARVWRNDLHGTVVVNSDGQRYAVNEPLQGVLFLYLPLVLKPEEATPTPTVTPTPTDLPTVELPTPTPTWTPTIELPTPTPTWTPTPPITVMPGVNMQCVQDGATEVCASVSHANPTANTTVTVYGRIRVNGIPQSGHQMTTRWHYKSTVSECDSGYTGADGVAQCARSIGRPSSGYEVKVHVTINGLKAITSFTPQ
jgi:hypothetical protein